MSKVEQHGGTALGLILGLALGLIVAAAVALYVSKASSPINPAGPMRSTEDRAEELKKNKDWNPNQMLQGSSAGSPTSSAVPDAAPHAPGSEKSADKAPPPAPTIPLPEHSKLKADSAAGKAENPTKPPSTSSRSGDPVADLIQSQGKKVEEKPSTGASSESKAAESYFVQVGAYARMADAESQRARLSLQGIESKISEHNQGGQVLYRVRVGPLNSRDAADQVGKQLREQQFDANVLRVKP